MVLWMVRVGMDDPRHPIAVKGQTRFWAFPIRIQWEIHFHKEEGKLLTLTIREQRGALKVGSYLVERQIV